MTMVARKMTSTKTSLSTSNHSILLKGKKVAGDEANLHGGLETLAGMGQCVLGYIHLNLDPAKFPEGCCFSTDGDKLNLHLENFCFVGLISMTDPPKATVPNTADDAEMPASRCCLRHDKNFSFSLSGHPSDWRPPYHSAGDLEAGLKMAVLEHPPPDLSSGGDHHHRAGDLRGEHILAHRAQADHCPHPWQCDGHLEGGTAGPSDRRTRGDRLHEDESQALAVHSGGLPKDWLRRCCHWVRCEQSSPTPTRRLSST